MIAPDNTREGEPPGEPNPGAKPTDLPPDPDPWVELPSGRIRESEYHRQLRELFPNRRARSP